MWISFTSAEFTKRFLLRSPCKVQLVNKASSHVGINPADAIASADETCAPVRTPASNQAAAGMAPSRPGPASAAQALTCAGTQGSGQVLPPRFVDDSRCRYYTRPGFEIRLI